MPTLEPAGQPLSPEAEMMASEQTGNFFVLNLTFLSKVTTAFLVP